MASVAQHDPMNAQPIQRQLHAALDLPSRNRKAMKIERLLDLAHRPQPIHMRATAGFRYRNICIEAWRATFEMERPDSLGRRMLDATPDALLKPLRRIIPTLIYRVPRCGAE